MKNKAFITKLLHVSAPTLMSRLLGIVRELLMVNYLGATGMADAFLTAWKVPNSLRKIFAEGAFSASFVPTVVSLLKRDGRASVSRLISVTLLYFESAVLLVSLLFMVGSRYIIHAIAPGFSVEQIARASEYLTILMPFIFFISSSALFAAALQAVDHFIIPAFAPVLLNVVFITALIICQIFNWPVTTLCYFILVGGFLQLWLHWQTYRFLGFTLCKFSRADIRNFWSVMAKFFVCAPSLGINEIGLFIDTSFASFLAPGSVSILYYAHRFMGIPQGLFAIPLSIVLLPHFSRVGLYAPKRLSFYLFEGIKLIWWVSLPVALIMGFFADDIFITLFVKPGKFSAAQAHETGIVLIIFLSGLFFFALNKILLNIYYAMHQTWIPGVVTVISTLLNVGLNIILMPLFQTAGLALATTLATGLAQSIMLILILVRSFSLKVYPYRLARFMLLHTLYVVLLSIPFALMYSALYTLWMHILPTPLVHFFTQGFGFWVWVGPLILLLFLCLWYMRPKHPTLRLYLLD